MRHVCNCKEPSPEIVTEEQTNRNKTRRRTREIEICNNCFTRTDKTSLTKWIVEPLT